MTGSATILSMLPKPKGRKAGDGREVLRLYPHTHWTGGGKRHFIYAVAFNGGVVKIGRTNSPRTRLTTHWRTGAGEVEWVHLFESCHDRTARMVEARVPAVMNGIAAKQINGSEWYFSSADKAAVIAAVRGVIRDCKAIVWRQLDQQERERRWLAEAAEVLRKHGLLPKGEA